MFIGFGLLALYFGQKLALGTPVRMGPGWVPRMLALVMMGLGGLICGIALVAGAGSTSGAPASIIISIKLGAASFDKTSSGNISLTGICREEECFNNDGELGSMVFKNNFLGHRWLLNLRSDVPAYVVTPRLVLIGARQ